MTCHVECLGETVAIRRGATAWLTHEACNCHRRALRQQQQRQQFALIVVVTFDSRVLFRLWLRFGRHLNRLSAPILRSVEMENLVKLQGICQANSVTNTLFFSLSLDRCVATRVIPPTPRSSTRSPNVMHCVCWNTMWTVYCRQRSQHAVQRCRPKWVALRISLDASCRRVRRTDLLILIIDKLIKFFLQRVPHWTGIKFRSCQRTPWRTTRISSRPRMNR